MYESLEALALHYAEPSPHGRPNASRDVIREALARLPGASAAELSRVTGYTPATIYKALRDFGIAPGASGRPNLSTHRVMMAIYEARDSYTNSATAVELVAATGYTYATVVRALERLKADGLLVPARYRTEALGYTGYGQAIPTEAIGRRQLEYALSDAGVAKARAAT